MAFVMILDDPKLDLRNWLPQRQSSHREPVPELQSGDHQGTVEHTGYLDRQKPEIWHQRNVLRLARLLYRRCLKDELRTYSD